ncbi:hypothetical protein EC919_11859 [Pseudomonas graminis]|nr:hypothetical protein EC919_11859 [Pseudomonas graminis]
MALIIGIFLGLAWNAFLMFALVTYWADLWVVGKLVLIALIVIFAVPMLYSLRMYWALFSERRADKSRDR